MSGKLILNHPCGDYRQWPAYGSSDLAAMREGPPSRVQYRRSTADEATDSMRVGTACHMAVLEPARFERTYAFKPEDMSFATKDGKAWRDAHADREILTHLQAETVRGVAQAFAEKREASDSLIRAHIEASLLWDDESGIALKGRPDWIGADGYIYDLKVSRFAAARSLPFRAWAEGWMHQAAHYRTGARAAGVLVNGCRLVVVHPQPPHPVYLIELKENDLDLLALENAETVRRLAECDRAGKWPGTSDVWETIDLPASALTASLGLIEPTMEHA